MGGRPAGTAVFSAVMEPVLVLRDTRLQVRPGETARAAVTVRNDGDLVEEYVFDVLGPAAAWTEVIPSSVSVVRRGESTVQMLFRPPVGPDTPAGNVPFALRCVSRDDPDSAAIVEGDLAVGAIHDLAVSMTPSVAKGRWGARWTARFDNRGTAPVRLRLSASDERTALGVALAPQQLSVDPGESRSAFLRVRPVRPRLLAATVRHRVRLTYAREAAGPGEPAAEGFVDVTYEHISVLTKAMAMVAALALVAVAVVAVVLVSRSGTEEQATEGGAAPPTPSGLTAKSGGPRTVTLSWNKLPGVTGYTVLWVDQDKIRESRKAEAEVNSFDWTGAEGTDELCFVLIAENKSGVSGQSEKVCSAPGPAESTDATPGGGGGPTSSTTDGVSPTPGSGGAGGAEIDEPEGAYVVYATTAKGDEFNDYGIQRSLELKGDIQDALAGIGLDNVNVAIGDSAISKQLQADGYTAGFYVLYTDGFGSQAEAEQFCVNNEAAIQETVPAAICVAEGGTAATRTPAARPTTRTPTVRPTTPR
jgi:hypothetical protein